MEKILTSLNSFELKIFKLQARRAANYTKWIQNKTPKKSYIYFPRVNSEKKNIMILKTHHEPRVQKTTTSNLLSLCTTSSI